MILSDCLCNVHNSLLYCMIPRELRMMLERNGWIGWINVELSVNQCKSVFIFYRYTNEHYYYNYYDYVYYLCIFISSFKTRIDPRCQVSTICFSCNSSLQLSPFEKPYKDIGFCLKCPELVNWSRWKVWRLFERIGY